MRLVDTSNVHSLERDARWITLFLSLVWIGFLLDRFLPLEQLGLIPRQWIGLRGVLLMPFLHGDLAHLIGNSIPLALLLMLMAGSRVESASITVTISVLGGLLLWLFGRGGTLHIGASVLVFGLISFLMIAALFERRLSSLLVAGVVGVLYASSLLRGILPNQPGVSWDGHLAGAVAGVIVAFMAGRWLKVPESPTGTT